MAYIKVYSLSITKSIARDLAPFAWILALWPVVKYYFGISGEEPQMLKAFMLALLLFPLQQFRIVGEVEMDVRQPGGRATLESPDGRIVMRGDVDREGEFQFGGVRAGSYWLTVTITGFEDVRRSVEVRPSLADENGNILVTLVSTAVRDEAQHTVSVNDLEIPEDAQREYRRAVDAGGDFEKVRAHLERAIELAPHFDEALNNLGTTYHREGNYEKSIELFERALAANPDSFHPRVNMGGSLLAAGHLERALEENTKAVDLRPDSSLANAQLGMSLFFLRRDEEAIPYFERVKELDEFSMNTPELYLSDIYLRKGDPKRATEELERFLERLPDHPRAPMVRERLRQFKSVPSPPF